MSPSAPVRTPAVALLGVLSLLGGILGIVPTASATTGRQAGRQVGQLVARQATRPGYLALGDSVAFGYRPPEVTPLKDYLHADNFTSYADVVAQRRHLRLANSSCPGETTASMIHLFAPSNGCESLPPALPGYRTLFPLHVAYVGTQLAYAVHYLRDHAGTRLVTLTVGANDLLLCTATADHCTGADFAATVAEVERNVGTILAAIRGTHYDRALVVVTYYSFDYADPVGTGVVRVLDAALARAAHRHQARVADGLGAFKKATAGFGGDSCAAGLLVALPNGTCNSHPSAEGHRVLAGAVIRALRG
jgi:lysophospholipase L1-like esterase